MEYEVNIQGGIIGMLSIRISSHCNYTKHNGSLENLTIMDVPTRGKTTYGCEENARTMIQQAKVWLGKNTYRCDEVGHQ